VAKTERLRRRIAERLASGLATEAWPRADTAEAVNSIIARLQTAAGDDLDRKLIIAGLTDHVIEVEDMPQACETCMYYKVHARFCELPELMLPVEPGWSCRLWRI
jgi:hypothetical protein